MTLTMNVQEALQIYHAAQEWPRCGQRWPTGDAEEAAAAALEGRNECGRTPEEEAALAATYAASSAAKKAVEEKNQQARDSLLSKVAPEEKTSKTIAAFAAAVDQLTVQEAESVGFSAIAIKAAERNRSVVIDRRGHILAA